MAFSISRAALWRGLLAALLGPALLCAPVAAAERPYDGALQLYDDEARAALAQGHYLRAEQLFWRLTELNPDDARALREGGRAAFALGDLAFAERTLGRVEALQGAAPDPEIRYLRAQALLALGREKEGDAELAEAERQLSPTPPDRQSTLWLARIHALRGDVNGAEALYLTVLPPDPRTPEHAEVTLYLVEAHIIALDWPGAERLLRAFLASQPEHVRGQEMLAWVLEGGGKLEEELPIRAALVRSLGDHPQHVLGQARALERASDSAGALVLYREASALGQADLGPDIDRMAGRQAPELAAGMTFAADPSGSIQGFSAGATLPFASGLRLAVTAAGAQATPAPRLGAPVMEVGAASTSVEGQLLVDRRGYLLAVGPTLRLPGVSPQAALGGSLAIRSPAGRSLEVHLAAELGQPWRESSATIRAGGVVDTIAAEAFATLLSGRVVLSLTAQGRRLGLEPMAGGDATGALQLFGAAGVDVVLWADAARLVRGQILDENLRYAATLASGLVVSYRHYELVSDHPFGARLVLVGRSRVEEGSAALRYVIDDAGAVGLELHGGLGRDTERELITSRVGGALLVAATAGTRLTAGYELANQSGTTLSGLRQVGSVSFHVDL